MTYAIQFDKTFLDGNLKGLSIPGQVLRCADRSHADRYLRLYAQVERENDFMRDAATGARFNVSNVGMVVLPAII